MAKAKKITVCALAGSSNPDYMLFGLEAAVRSRLEEFGWTYSDLAVRTGTNKSNVARDLRPGGYASSTLRRLFKTAKALGLVVNLELRTEEKQKQLADLGNDSKPVTREEFRELIASLASLDKQLSHLREVVVARGRRGD